MKNKTTVRTDELNLLLQGIRRALSMYDGQLEIKFEDKYLQLFNKSTGECCSIKLSDNVKFNKSK